MPPVWVSLKLLFGFFLLLPLIILAFFCTLSFSFLLLPFLSIFKSLVILYYVWFKVPIRGLEVVLAKFCSWVFGDFGRPDQLRFPSPYDSQDDGEDEDGDDDDNGGENGKRKHEDAWTFEALKAAIKREKLVFDGKPISIRIRGWLTLSKTAIESPTQSLPGTPPQVEDQTSTNFDDFSESSSSTAVSTCSRRLRRWKFLWGCKVPGKTRLFMFRACSDTLPTNEHLSRKQTAVENRCRVCGHHGESILHVLRECAFAKQVWDAVPIPPTPPRTSVLEWVHDASNSLDPHCFALFVTTCWFLWKNRNDRLHPNARDLMKSVLDHRTSYLTSPDSASKIPQWWRPPCRGGSVKVNFEGVVFSEDGNIGMGVVVRNEKGEFVAGMARRTKITAVVPPAREIGKAAAATEALRFGLEKGFVDVVVEGDSANVIRALKGHERVANSEYGDLYADAKSLAASFVRCEFSIVRRTGNKAAHVVARCARDVDHVTWTDEPPSFLMPYIITDIPW